MSSVTRERAGMMEMVVAVVMHFLSFALSIPISMPCFQAMAMKRRAWMAMMATGTRQQRSMRLLFATSR